MKVDFIYINNYNEIVMSNNSNKDPFNIINYNQNCISNNSELFEIDTNIKDYIVIHIQSNDEIGIYGRGISNITCCAIYLMNICIILVILIMI